MNKTIEKLLNGEQITEREAKVIHIFLNNVDIDIDKTYEQISSAEKALATANDKTILIELFKNNMNAGLWKGLDRYKFLSSYLKTPFGTEVDEKSLMFMNPFHVLQGAKSNLLERMKIDVYENRHFFNNFIETSSIDFLDEYMKEYNAICVLNPESNDNHEDFIKQSVSGMFGVPVDSIHAGQLNNKAPIFIRIGLGMSAFFLRIQSSQEFYKMSGKPFVNTFTTILRVTRDNFRDRRNKQKIDPKENKNHIIEKYHEKVILGKDALLNYIESL